MRIKTLILLLLSGCEIGAQTPGIYGWVWHNDTLFYKKSDNDSVQMNLLQILALSGGATNEVLKKNSAGNYDWVWSTVAGAGDLLAANNLSDVASVATARSNLGLVIGTDVLAPNGNGSVLTGLTKSQVGLANSDNTSDVNKPVSTAQQTALNLKANLASPTFTGTVSGITATMVGLGNVTNESKATMFTSPTFTGTPTGIGIPVYSRVTGSNATTTGQALVNITGLSNALTTNATYEFEAVLSVSTSAVTTGTAYGVNYSVAGGAVEAHITGASTSTASKTLRINALNTATTLYLATSAQSGGILIKGIITTGANAGNLTISHLKLTSGTSTVFINSYLKTTRIL